MTDVVFKDLKCAGCGKGIFSTARCVAVKDKLYCTEVCADRVAIMKLRKVKTLWPTK
jgi:predicted RNA methylase